MAVQDNSPKKNTSKIILIVIGLLVVGCICLLLVGAGGYLLFGDKVQQRFFGSTGRELIVGNRSADGSVSGEFIYRKGLSKQRVFFTVDENGTAFYNLDSSKSEPLKIDFTDDKAQLTWGGTSFDGYGSLNGEELEAFNALMESDLMKFFEFSKKIWMSEYNGVNF